MAEPTRPSSAEATDEGVDAATAPGVQRTTRILGMLVIGVVIPAVIVGVLVGALSASRRSSPACCGCAWAPD